MPDLGPAACAAALAERFPGLFGAGVVLPVKLRIHVDVQQRAPGVFSRKSLSQFLHRHTTGTAYIRKLLEATTRFDLDGQPAGDIADEHRVAAQLELDRRKALSQARRQAQRQGGPARRPPQPASAGVEQAGGDATATGATPEGGDAAMPRPDDRGQPRGDRPPREGAGRREAGADRPRGRPASGPRSGGPRSPSPREQGRGTTQGSTQGPAQGSGQGFGQQRDARGSSRPPRPQRDPVPASGDSERRDHAEADAQAAGQAEAQFDPATLAARRERSALLRAFETSTLTKSNFLVLKRMKEADLDAQLAQAQAERGSRPASGGAQASQRAERPERPERPHRPGR